ncbi:LPXTG cell wall anchor domain-containing protein [Pediococcus inopinatus]|uniref:LPXTG cell wall anchor domain-containing protein n=1 Tax=Pediococcus inopinatus TaxID=114090 RepID=UPI002B2619F1|nr:LPXTG cell wall anchor domain-containing protein [Pediococcus inopinatus]WPC18359.1 LPXTG cell wall anchor domain-containing protein [Pediococcus inopinatus]
MKKTELKQNRKYALLASTLLFSAGILGMGVTPNQINADTSNVATSSKENVGSTSETAKADLSQTKKDADKSTSQQATQNTFKQVTEYQSESGENLATADTAELNSGENYNFSAPKSIAGYQVNYAKSTYTLTNEDGTNTRSFAEFGIAAGVGGDPSSWTASDWQQVLAFLNETPVNNIGENYSVTLTYKYDVDEAQGTFKQTTEYQNAAGNAIADSTISDLKAGDSYSLSAPKNIAGYKVNYGQSTYTLNNEDGVNSGSVTDFAEAAGVDGDPSTWTTSDWQTVLNYINKEEVPTGAVGKDYGITLTYKYDAVKPTINVTPKLTIKKGSSFNQQDLFNSIVSSTGTTLSYAEAIANGSLVVTGPSNFNTNIAGNRGTYTFTYTDPTTGLSVTATGVVVVAADSGSENPGTPGGDGDNGNGGNSNGNGGTNSNQNQSGNQGNGSGQGTNQNPTATGQETSGTNNVQKNASSVSANKELPQTSETSSIAGRNVGFIGLLLMATLALFGLARKKRY